MIPFEATTLLSAREKRGCGSLPSPITFPFPSPLLYFPPLSFPLLLFPLLSSKPLACPHPPLPPLPTASLPVPSGRKNTSRAAPEAPIASTDHVDSRYRAFVRCPRFNRGLPAPHNLLLPIITITALGPQPQHSPLGVAHRVDRESVAEGDTVRAQSGLLVARAYEVGWGAVSEWVCRRVRAALVVEGAFDWFRY